MKPRTIRSIERDSKSHPKAHTCFSYLPHNSTEECVKRISEAQSSRKTSFDSTNPAIHLENRDQHILRVHQRATLGMTTFYSYQKDGTITTSDLDPAAQIFTYGPPDPGNLYEQNGDLIGAYLARRDMAYHSLPVPSTPQVQTPLYPPYAPTCKQPSNGHAGSESGGQDYWPGDRYESSSYSASFVSRDSNTLGFSGWASQSGLTRPYPDPEDIRHLHTLHSILPYIQPERKVNALGGPFMDIVEQDTGVKFACQVPKKLLVLFLGRASTLR